MVELDPSGPYDYFNPWWHPHYRRGTLHSMQSVTKTVTSVVIGIAVGRKEVPSIDTPVLSFFDPGEVGHLTPRDVAKIAFLHLKGGRWEDRPVARRATDTKLGRDVAIKVLPAELAQDPERLDRALPDGRAAVSARTRGAS